MYNSCFASVITVEEVDGRPDISRKLIPINRQGRTKININQGNEKNNETERVTNTHRHL